MQINIYSMIEYLKEFPNLYDFLNNLNWTYIIMLVIIMYGIKYTKEFDWYKNIIAKLKLQKVKTWTTGFLVGLVFCLFSYLESTPEDPFTWGYISQLMRSWFMGVIFSPVFVDIPVFILNKVGNIIDKNGVSEKDK